MRKEILIPQCSQLIPSSYGIKKERTRCQKICFVTEARLLLRSFTTLDSYGFPLALEVWGLSKRLYPKLVKYGIRTSLADSGIRMLLLRSFFEPLLISYSLENNLPSKVAAYPYRSRTTLLDLRSDSASLPLSSTDSTDPKSDPFPDKEERRESPSLIKQLILST